MTDTVPGESVPSEETLCACRSTGEAPTKGASDSAQDLRDRFWVIGPAALLLAFFWQPALKLIAPFILTSISSLLVVGLVLMEVAARVSGRRLRTCLYIISSVFGLIGIGEAIYFTSLAVPVSDANDRHCLAIEAHMLQNVSSRAGDAAMFQALGCRPQRVAAAKLRLS